jgi:hypothetical protein
MPLTRKIKVLVPLVIGLALAAAGSYILWRINAGPLPFDPQRWAAARSYSDTTRYRMSEDLLKRMRSEQWSLDRTLRELGKPESGAGWEPGNRELGANLFYGLGEKPSPVNGGFYLLLRFDENGRLIYSGALPQ